jgi:hypothetical protein
MEYHESGAPFLAEIDAMYEKIDAWFAANDPANKPVRPTSSMLVDLHPLKTLTQ